MAQSIPPALEQELRKFENLRKQYESFQMTNQTMQQELNEVNATLDELKKQPDDVTTYKTVGSVMFEVDKPRLMEDLDDRQKTLEMRLASTKKKLEKLSTDLQELQNKIQVELGKQNLRLQ